MHHTDTNIVPSAAESLGHPTHVQAPQAPVNEVNRSRLTTKKSLPNFSFKNPTSARSIDTDTSASTREYHAGDVPGSARREFMGQVSINQAFFSAFIPSGEHQEQKIRAATASSDGEQRMKSQIVGMLHFGWAFKLGPTMAEMARRWGTQPKFPLSRDQDPMGGTQPLFRLSRDQVLRVTSFPSDNVDMEPL